MSTRPKAKLLTHPTLARRARTKERGDAARGAPTREGGSDTLHRWMDAKGVRKVKLGAIDLDGVWRGKYVSLDKFFSAAKGGLGFCDVVFGWDLGDELLDNTEVTGWHTGYPDAKARVDVSTARIIPWEPDTAAFLLDFVNPDGSPFEASPRQLLQKVAARARQQGFLPRFGAEYEFFIFKEQPHSLREKGFQSLSPLTPGMFGYSWLRTSLNAPLVHALIDGCNAFGLDIEGFHTETGPGVFEAAIRYDDLEKAADKAALFKTVVKEICARHGLTACFMAKVNPKLPGCSGHVHQSLWNLKGDENLFHDPDAPQGMSARMRHYIGGQIALMPELTALYWPTINSYKRSVENTWAPTTATWGVENRTCAIRVIGDSPKSMRLEYRQLGADMNAYVGMAVSLAAGLWGIENEVEPPAPVLANAYSARHARPLPRTLKDAVTLLKESEHARELLGDAFVDHFVRTRDWEVRQYERAVTTWELERYLELI
ncbi:glutamine synthetase [Corallococcus sp. H22C18031201]|uniref:glutamine synthetase family protein n=1 Tax=Citreicoccus inhibens TaxID=2849499 RepID=UPI000E72BAF7|nr:glutamine synthetase family protein [Citreicoccus inhibens]MBU8899249.1 glutamine synthetase family protein [Citreicoccus inhibens]RJS25735.1 glutamine synthetase [Corallococcus sp. H22C18031201]